MTIGLTDISLVLSVNWVIAFRLLRDKVCNRDWHFS
jgi:hypothetical protein